MFVVALNVLRNGDNLFTLGFEKSGLLQKERRFKMEGDSSGKACNVSALFSEGEESHHCLNSVVRRLKAFQRYKYISLVGEGT